MILGLKALFALLFWIVIFIISAIVLGKSADSFANSASEIGLFLGLSPIMIGIAIISLGTSLPELVVSVLTVIEGNTEIVIANVIGSNITNIVLILGIAALISARLEIIYKNIHIDFFVGATFLLFIAILDTLFTVSEAILFIIIALFYVWGAFQAERKDTKQAEQIVKQKSQIKNKPKPSKRQLTFFLISPLFLFLGAQFTLIALAKLSGILGLGQEAIAAVGVALGTSLPELATTFALARRGKSELIIGNIMGSNIFNILLVMGIPALISPLNIPSHILTLEMPILLVVTLLYFFITLDKELSRPKGLLLLAFYVFFVAKVLGLF